jgi:DNA end-binding protein Ku
MASSLVDSLSGDFDPSDFTDQYRAALESVVEAKIEGRDLIPAPESGASETSGTVVDLVAALQASIAAVKAGKAAAPKAVAKTAASKGTASKSAASKSAASKVAAKPAAAAKAVEKKPVRARRSA